MNIFLIDIFCQNILSVLKNICHISASCRGRGGCGVGVVVCSGGVPHHSSLGTETRTRGLQSAPTSAASTRRHPHTAGNTWGVKGLGTRVPTRHKISKVYIKVFHRWCFIMQFYFEINEDDNNFVTRYDFKHIDAVYASKYHF